MISHRPHLLGRADSRRQPAPRGAEGADGGSKTAADLQLRTSDFGPFGRLRAGFRTSDWRRARRADALAVGGLALLGALQLWSAAGPGRLPQNLDLMLQYVPNAAYLARSLAAGHVPLWNPYQGTGMPFAADPGTGAWYLPDWLPLLVLPLYAAVRVILWTHLLWAALGIYLYLRAVVRVGASSAWIGAASYALTTWLPGLTGMAAVLSAVAWLPWIVLLAHLAAARGGRWIPLLGCAGALQLLAGWPAGAYLSWLAAGWLAVTGALSPGAANSAIRWCRGAVAAPVHRTGRGDRAPTPGTASRENWLDPLSPQSSVVNIQRSLRPWWEGWLRLALGAALAACLAAVLIVPAIEFVGQTNYAQTRPLERLASEGYLTLLSWFRPAGGTGSLESSQLYLGMAPLLLALAGAAFGRRTDRLRYGLLALLATLVAFGTHGPLFATLYRWLPGFRIVYLPARLGVVAAFALACLAALGAERLSRGPWRVRHVLVIAALAAALPPLLLLQFWQSEGYDSFRRLLTNLGRFAGGPYLTRWQEVQYLAFGALTLLALFLAARWRRAPHSSLITHHSSLVWPAALAVLTAADLGLAQGQAHPPGFAPVTWYAPAEATAAELAPSIGSERFTGLQWHGTEHFLNDFPASTQPALLPPNLGTFAGVNDAAAYNPLLLRRAAAYFDQITLGQKDDHWLWLDDFQSAAAARLALAGVLAVGDDWRVFDRRLSLPVRLPPDGAAQMVWSSAASGDTVDAHRLLVITYLGEATRVPQGTPTIELLLRTATGDEQRVELRAGVDTAEWAYGRGDVRAAAQHAQALVALETRLQGPVEGRFTVYEYSAVEDLSLPAPLVEIRGRSLVPGVTGFVDGVYVEPLRAPEARPLPGGARLAPLSEPQPRAALSGGSATIVRDGSELVEIRTSSGSAGTLVLADAFYPGWSATVDGQRVTIVPHDGLFRAVDIPAGEHTVVFRYQPRSLWLGGALSVLGLAVAGVLAWMDVRRPQHTTLSGGAASDAANWHETCITGG